MLRWFCNKLWAQLAVCWLSISLQAGPLCAQELVVTFGGDVNFARSRTAPIPDRVVKFASLPLSRATRALAPLWAKGDLNIINVETVVARRNGVMQGKAFVFRSHPDQLRYLMDLGVNGFSLANNHAWDHGQPGLYDTHSFFTQAARTRRLVFAGTGTETDAFRPGVVSVGPARIAMASLSFGGGRFPPGPRRYGMASLDNPAHVDAVFRNLKAVDADLKILTLHWGAENYTQLQPGQRRFVERAWSEAGVHLVIGHHPHVVRGVAARPETGRAAFYSLGNLFFIGGAEKDSEPLGRDYGLFGQAVYQISADGPRLTALGSVPLKGVHQQPRHMTPRHAARTVQALNQLSRRDLQDDAARFEIRPDLPDRAAACFAPPYGETARAMCCQDSQLPECAALPDLM